MKLVIRAARAVSRLGVIGIAREIIARAASHIIRARNLRAQARAVAIAQSPLSRREKFEAIYREGVWANAAPTFFISRSGSGHGSTEPSTRALRAELTGFIRDEGVSSLFDAPCGDYHWMRWMQFGDGFRYVGGDIVTSVVQDLDSKFASPARRFISVDLTRDTFPECDAWLCKDCLQHLSFDDVSAVLRNFANSSIKWALISNHTDVNSNYDIQTGDFRHLDLTKPPFNLPPPRRVLQDIPVDNEPRGIYVWLREDIKDHKNEVAPAAKR
jgi:hypothetical protein